MGARTHLLSVREVAPDVDDYLRGLVMRTRLSRSAWRILVAILAAEEPVSARAVARQLGVHYTFTKRMVRRLRGCGLLEATPAGLVARFDPPGWEDAVAENAAEPSPSPSNGHGPARAVRAQWVGPRRG